MSRNRVARLLLLGAAPLALAGPALAQEPPAVPSSQPTSAPPPIQGPVTDAETITVTGSRLPNTSLTAAAPVTVLNRAAIDISGTSSIGTLLRDIPAASPAVSETAGRGNDGSANVALRGLGAVNTLVLINGRRQLSNSAGGTVDLNSIPFEAVDRVEVLQDGASAVYGSDAIAGVVNLITRRDFDGLQLKASYGLSVHGDLPERQASAVFGRKFDGGSFVFTGSWKKAGGNVIADRRISRDPDWRSRGGRNFRDSAPLNSAFSNIDPANPSRILIIRDGVQQATTIADFRDYVYPGTTTPLTSGNDGINYWKYESSASAIQQVNLFFNGEYALTDTIKMFGEASYNNRRSLGFLAPDYFDGNVTVSAQNIYNPFGRNLVVYRTLTELLTTNGATRANDVNSNLYRGIAGLEGEVLGFKWDVSANLQHLFQQTYGGRQLVTSRLQRAAGPNAACVAVTGCVPINLFGANGTVTPAMLNAITEDRFNNITADLKSYVANVSGTLFALPAGDVGLAVGTEYRTEKFSQVQDNAPDLTTPRPPFRPPVRKVAEVYGEIGVPVLRDVPFFYRLDVEAAVRFSHYNAFGNTTNPKFGIKWRPFADLLIRGSYGTAFRAPTFTEANTTQVRGYRPVTDPCQSAAFATYPGCNNVRAPVTTGTFVVTGGNPGLRPEMAKTYTAGFVYTPNYIPRLSFTADVYRITKSNIIGIADVDYIIAQNALRTQFVDAVVRNPDNSINQVSAVRDNLLSQRIQGIDMALAYQTPDFSFGRLNLSAGVTYLDSYKLSPSASQPPTERAGTYSTAIGTLAHWRANGTVGWTIGNFSTNVNMRYVGPVTNTASFLTNGVYPRSTDYIQADLVFNFDVPKQKLRLTAGVDNLWDEMPPYLEGNYFNGFDAQTFDSRGAFFYFRVTKGF